ncbi:activating signal cointegrator 1 complex subunit 3-like [Limulus polyphemus]|uniref:U5 small nuclear ribonucleoprotein 200 kDa helicase n=1 Tax=Limulus polyphemus TaxID=6850 RepID=A0ABM1S4B0_LIMPO|nr:activating signal cointegrator 1 complex subunit 3-like [Limulus polyphemus]
MVLPRLTKALRAFSYISDPSVREVDEEVDVLAKKRKERAERHIKNNTLTWNVVRKAFQNLSDPSQEVVTTALKELKNYAKELIGSESSEEMIESAAVYLMEVFQDCNLIGYKQMLQLQIMFGSFSSSIATLACKLVGKMLSWLPDKERNNFLKQNNFGEEEFEEFGYKIRFVGYQPFDDSSLILSWDQEDSKRQDLFFTLDLEKPVRKDNNKEESKRQKKMLCFDKRWLEHEVKKYYAHPSSNLLGLDVDDIVSSILAILMSEKSIDELQNDLFELLGVERLSLIQPLLEHRKEIVTTRSSGPVDVSLAGVMSNTKQRSAYGCQVTIQSEKERQLKKQFKKEDRRIQRDQARNLDDNTFIFDPQYLRDQRELQLLSAKRKPLFSHKSVAGHPKNLPYVFDSYAEAKLSAGYVGGVKMTLPWGFEHVKNSKYEEVNIPPSEQPPTQVGQKLIPISTLDELGQVGFRGMKTLNRIQSIVFPSAYYTNENLLICAPTGAGKTNIAMLTILHQIKQHMEGSVLKKDKFKIVYVAPMKALAAEMVRNFNKRLEPLGVLVRELTGDMQLTKTEILQTQMLVTTPEKWDVVTRKSTGDIALIKLVKLIIIDEVHLLHGDRGSVLEALVARTLRQVESSQSMIRIIGLSATLPNYLDVARFLCVTPHTGLFFFDGRFRPVPLGQTFIGVKSQNPLQQLQEMDEVCYQKVASTVEKGHQVMVFVHARNATVRTAIVLKEMAQNKGQLYLFCADQNPQFGAVEKQINKSRNNQLKDLFHYGFAIHHAGMIRTDRNLVEKYFSEGLIKVLVCTSTLAWGVNLPAHAVVIKGTEIYDSKHGSFVDLGILDVMQIFGRAGRPQFDKTGHGIIITTHDKLSHYLSLLTNHYPIESNFIQNLADNLNAEISLGTVTTIDEAVEWLKYTYLYVRLAQNPQAYGFKYTVPQSDPHLEHIRRELIISAAKELDKAHMIRYEESTGYLHATDMGRTASHFYIKYATVEAFNERLKPIMTEADILGMLSQAQEFDQLKVSYTVLSDNSTLLSNFIDISFLNVEGGSENAHGKVNILIQTHISRGQVNSFSLVSDMAYVVQNGVRILRSLFEMVLKKNWSIMAGRLLTLSKVLEHQIWQFESPLRQFGDIGPDVLSKLESKKISVDILREMDHSEIGQMIRHVKMGKVVKTYLEQIPLLTLNPRIQPITRTVLKITLGLTPDFQWNDKIHGKTEAFWIWVEDPESNYIYHSEYFLLTRKQTVLKETQNLVFTIPVYEPLPSQYLVRAISDHWLGSESTTPVSFQHLILPERHPPHTSLLDLQPLPVEALNDAKLEDLYNFSHFNSIQTQLFHTLYYTDNNVLLGAPTGSGKTIAAEIAMFRLFREYPGSKVVYIAPLKALVRERIKDWKVRLEEKINKKVVELTGDVMPDARAITAADVIVTTPEKWDGVSRSWQIRNYVREVNLMIIDEIHLLGEDRGPVLEVIVSRTNFICVHMDKVLRIIGLSTALANAKDLADWLRIDQVGLYNFRPSVRPVPLEVHISGYPGKHYCPRMALMNKPAYQAICTHSPNKPVLIFVSSRRQTRLTALDLIAFLAAEDNPRQWNKTPESEMESYLHDVRDQNLKLTLAFGIGIHHAGLHDQDRQLVEFLFVEFKIQVLIATATLAWGVNFPAHLVIVKGTEYYDGKTQRYVDFPITDVLQMMGRAGRPQFDDQGVAVILVHDIKKHFYKKFLYEPFPVESSLLQVLPDHLNAEIVAGTITSKQNALDYITWTYFFRRLVENPSYYGLESVNSSVLNKYLSGLVDSAVKTLEKSHCLQVGEDNRALTSTVFGRIASFYYLSHLTVQSFCDQLGPDRSLEDLLKVLTSVQEYAELPVRHNEDAINSELAKRCPLEVSPYSYDSPYTKAYLLFQAHFSRLELPCSDYLTDLKSVLDQSIRILQAMIDVSADQGWLVTTLRVIGILQMVIQACWQTDSTLLSLPHIECYHLHDFGQSKNQSNMQNGSSFESLPELMAVVNGKYESLAGMLRPNLDENKIEQVFQTLIQLPVLHVTMKIKGWWMESAEEEERTILIEQFCGVQLDKQWIQVHADQEYILNVKFLRRNRIKKKDTKALAPRFPKQKDEGWFLVLGDIENQELIAIKRIGYISSYASHQLMFYTPESPGRVIYTIFILSDCYLGLDQQYDICLDVLEPSLMAQVNTEVHEEV